MKTYRKNRTQKAQLFLINGKGVLGFLIGQENSIRTIQKLNGDVFNTSDKGKKLKSKEVNVISSDDYVVVKCPI
jgi:hypothetical protein